MSQYWFKPKRYGLGAVPATWQGWALTGGYLALILTLAVTLGGGLKNPSGFTFLVLAGALTIVFIGIAWRTTKGGWRWRWGEDEK